ncbi:hypothetical protein, partial [Helicobacter fennelliae]|uniref:hypothetical protein n=1 Tax=Helicobacter fennelliae TaxID=215 RepID=UPI003908A2AA
MIYSFVANEDLSEDEGDGIENPSSKEFLESAMQDYNAMFQSGYTLDSSSNSFDN